MVIEKIIDTYCGEHNEAKKANIRSWFTQIEKMSKDVPLEKSLRSKEFLLKCFTTSKTSTVSRSQYQRIKEILVYIFDCYGIDKSIIPSRDEVIESSQMYGFFGDLMSALSLVDEVGCHTVASYSPNNGLIRIKSIVILAWLGFSPEEIVQVVRSDIKYDKAICIQRGEEKIELTNELFRILSLQAESSGVMTFPRGRIYPYKVQTEYLIKNRSGEPMLADHLHHLFKQFNAVANNLGVLSFKGLKISSLFVRIYEDKSDEDICAKIQKYAQCDKHVSYGYKRLYLQWMKKFHKEEI